MLPVGGLCSLDSASERWGRARDRVGKKKRAKKHLLTVGGRKLGKIGYAPVPADMIDAKSILL